ncbi:O-antigen ligase family protein [Candidatus Saccharibacteria bacterium]|nr:O-antigen ligase family protein [Candidatus Saccharibacteria bacterium]
MNQFINKFYLDARKHPDKYLLALLAFLLPFERIPSFSFAGVTLRPSLFIGGLIILRAIWFVMKFKKFKPNSLMVPLALFVLWLFILIPGSINHMRATQVFIFTLYTSALAVSVGIIYQKQYLAAIIKGLFAGAAATSLFAIFQYFGDLYGLPQTVTGLATRYKWNLFGYARPQATALEPLYFASYLLLPIAVVVSILLFGSYKKSRLLWGLLFLFSLPLFLTVSRGGLLGYIGLALTLVVIYACMPKHRSGKIWPTLAIMLGAYLCSILIITVFHKPIEDTQSKNTGSGSYVSHVTDINENSDSRAMSRALAIDLIKKYPIMGIGPGQFGPATNNNQQAYFGWPIVNNEPLELLAETGVVGFALLLSFFGALVWAAVRILQTKKWQPEHIVVLALLGYLTAQAIQYQTFSTLYVIQLWFAVGLLLGVVGFKAKTNEK